MKQTCSIDHLHRVRRGAKKSAWWLGAAVTPFTNSFKGLTNNSLEAGLGVLLGIFIVRIASMLVTYVTQETYGFRVARVLKGAILPLLSNFWSLSVLQPKSAPYFAPKMADESTPTFFQLLSSVGLLPYRLQFLAEGFDDVVTLLDMTEDDMVKFGIGSDHRTTLQGIFMQLRSTRAASLAYTHLSLEDSSMHWVPSIMPTVARPETYRVREAASPLGWKMLVPASTWTSVTNDSSVVERLLALYFCWEYPIFASLSMDHFVKDFCEGRARYCSPILVNALLALGYCFSAQSLSLVSEHEQHASGNEFFKEAQRLLELDEDHHSLTTVQAFSIMSLRALSCGSDSESNHYSGQGIRLAIEMGIHIHTAGDEDESAVKTATFWGAFGLDK